MPWKQRQELRDDTDTLNTRPIKDLKVMLKEIGNSQGTRESFTIRLLIKSKRSPPYTLNSK
jgi:hypothetical protein